MYAPQLPLNKNLTDILYSDPPVLNEFPGNDVVPLIEYSSVFARKRKERTKVINNI
jgi:hypothetical protein